MGINCGVTVPERLFNVKAGEVMLGRTLKNQFGPESGLFAPVCFSYLFSLNSYELRQQGW